jgi:tRNA(Ile)-lysidine synthase
MAGARARVSGSGAVRDFLAAVRRTVDAREMLKGGERVIAAVSGGPDSMALLHALVRLRAHYDLDLHVAHFDHRLRPDSKDDAAFVARAARRLDLPVTVGEADSTEPVKGESPEETARARRSRFLQGLARELSAARVATGHTLDDQAETILMHFLGGSGRRGISGMPPVRWYTIRPLIDVRRAQVEAFCRALRLRPRMDPTNDDRAFLRNAIRHETLPYLSATMNARLPEALVRMADLLRDEDYYLDRQTGDLAVPERVENGSRIPVETLRALSPAIQRRAIRLLARTEDVGLDWAQTEAVRALALGGETGKQLHLPGPLSARLEYGFLVLGRAPASMVPAVTVELAVPGETVLPGGTMRVRSWNTAERPAAWPDSRMVCVLDADRVTFPLRVRRWRTGDRFRPLGMSRRKKVGDFFTDEKVPRAERAGVPLVVGKDDAVVWIVGHRIDDSVKVRPATRRYCWLAAEGA